VSCSYVSKRGPNIYKGYMMERGQPRQSVPGTTGQSGVFYERPLHYPQVPLRVAV
jgi:hypothetical protein